MVGRTGAGKSSLGALLLELTTHTGTITIDGVDISQVEKQVLRKRISYVPQVWLRGFTSSEWFQYGFNLHLCSKQPVLFNGTLRFNLDPFDECTDDAIWKSLEHVRAKEEVPRLCINTCRPMYASRIMQH